MIYRCYAKCPHFTDPCEISIEEAEMLVHKTTMCPTGEDDCFRMINDDNEFFCLVVGSRNFNGYEKMKIALDRLLENKQNKEINIVSGGAKGADSLAERYAKEKGYALIVMPANWDEDGKRAGFIRNERMHKYIASKEDRGVVAFWDGKSKGTEHSFDLCKKYNNPLRVIRF